MAPRPIHTGANHDPGEQHYQLKTLLSLAHNPVDVSGTNDTDQNTAELAPAPSACSLWRRADTARFTADARPTPTARWAHTS